MKKEHLLITCIIILAALLRLFYLNRIPSGFIPEEVSTGWNAYSLLKTGRDEWGVSLPIIFRETGGFKLALNSYLIVPLMWVFGLNEFSVRFSTAIGGILAVFLTYIVSRRLFTRQRIAISAAFLLAINPWHISMSRYGVDVNWGIPLFLLGLACFLKSLTSKKMLLIAAVFFALTYYTYFNYVVFTFLFIFLLFFLYRKNFSLKSDWKIITAFFILQFLFLSPYILQRNLTIRFSQATSISNIGFVNRINEHRGACLTVYPNFLCRIFYNQPLERLTEITRNLINHYSTKVFFLYGSQNGLSGMPDRWGLFHLFEFPLIAFGIFMIIRKRIATLPLFAAWALVYGLPSSLAAEEHIWRMMTILPLPQIIEAWGLITMYSVFKNNKLQIFSIAFGILIISYSLTKFNTDYFSYFPYAQGSYSYFGFRDLYQYLSKVEKEYNSIIIAPIGLGFNQLYIYYLFYTSYDPGLYQLGYNIDRKVGDQNWVWVNRIGKWYFVSELGKESYPLTEKTLLVVDDEGYRRFVIEKKGYSWIKFNTSLSPSPIKTIYHANGNIVFKIYRLTKAQQVYIEETKNIN